MEDLTGEGGREKLVWCSRDALSPGLSRQPRLRSVVSVPFLLAPASPWYVCPHFSGRVVVKEVTVPSR